MDSGEDDLCVTLVRVASGFEVKSNQEVKVSVHVYIASVEIILLFSIPTTGCPAKMRQCIGERIERKKQIK